MTPVHRQNHRSTSRSTIDILHRDGPAHDVGPTLARNVRQIILLRGINIGPNNRIAMPALRESLAGAGFEDVATYLQSGNVVVSSELEPEQLASDCEKLIADEFGLSISVVVRTRAQLAAVVKHDPLGDVADQPKLYQVSFCASEPDAKAVSKAAERAVEGERVLVHGREIYAWLPHGIARSKLATQLAKQGLGTTATARNWTTVTKLLELADA
jgi:uncharacterized protein (DUF1697 family)